MPFSITPISRGLQIYKTQVKIAELNKQMPVKTVQRQVDEVTLSDEGRLAFKSLQARTGFKPSQTPSSG